MKILFLAGALEPGRDGVGDYTRSLAGECHRLGHETFLLSLNDPWANPPLRQERLLRLGTKITWSERVRTAQSFVNEFRPALVSLQFVPYSFHAKGLSFALPRLLGTIAGKATTHVMFHELWIGEQQGASPKHRVLGFCQQKIIAFMLKRLACQVIHTSIPPYVELLTRCGFAARYLPMFGSVPVVQAEAAPRTGDGILRLGMFGSVHPEWSPDDMVAQLRTLGRPVQFSHAGRIGPGESVWRDLTDRYGGEISLHRLGEQSLTSISRFFASLDFGVATTPLSLIGKSSSVAAMLDHGIPVIVSRNDVHFRGIPQYDPTSELLIPVNELFCERLKSARRHAPQPRLPETAKQFLKDIGA